MKNNLNIAIIIRISAIILFIICIFATENVLIKHIFKNDGIERVYGKNQFIKYVYEQMQERKSDIKVRYIGNDYLDVFEMFEKEQFLDVVADIDDGETSDDFDYLSNNLSKMKTSINIKYNGATEALFNIDIDWRESYEETQEVNEQIKLLIDELSLNNMNTYDKIKTMHDYIIDNVEYDIECKNENAHTALFDKLSTCQGYSLLFYKIMTDIGINCRYITGTGINEESGPHGWNIVQIGDKWYNIDVTWDDPVYINASGTIERNEMNYMFFLKGLGEFDESHVRDDKFLTDEFMEKHPMSEVDFDVDTYIEDKKVYVSRDTVRWSFTDEEILGQNGLYRKVLITNLSTYKHLIPNIISGFSNLVLEKGFFGAIGNTWCGLTIFSRITYIMFIIVIGLNIAYAVIDEEKLEEDIKEIKEEILEEKEDTNIIAENVNKGNIAGN